MGDLRRTTGAAGKAGRSPKEHQTLYLFKSGRTSEDPCREVCHLQEQQQQQQQRLCRRRQTKTRIRRETARQRELPEVAGRVPDRRVETESGVPCSERQKDTDTTGDSTAEGAARGSCPAADDADGKPHRTCRV
eukprot:365129-Chlamydomonas_euryale.AAC.7